ncbi:helix-turn-helix domain-containing protein [Caulifigura coniformis]|uniref:helix-turn-helix domain-containing protein n=1 Tax=Caulifigura coniformis TaxID=2527983 RepID=UPI0011A9B0EE
MQLFTRKETADRLRVSLDTLERLASSGRLRPCRIGRLVRFSEDTINEFIHSCQSPPPDVA